jgi:hypothetical protein
MRKAGLDHSEVSRHITRFRSGQKKLLINVKNATTYYSLTRDVINALDTKYQDCLRPASTITASNAIAALTKQFPDLAACPYWQELSICHQNGALRATVIMAWNLIYNRLCEYILADPVRTANFNQKSSKPVATRDDFTEFRESDVLARSKGAGIIKKNVHTVLAEKLERRNMFAHASGMVPIPHEVDALVTDLIRNVLPRLT